MHARAKSPPWTRPAMRPPAATLAALLLALLAGCADGGGGGAGGDGGAGAGGGASGGNGDGATGTGSPAAPGASAPPAVTLEVSATGAYPVNPGFDPATATVPAGAAVHVVFRNEDTVPVVSHNWVVEGVAGAGSDTIAPGETAEFDFVAPATPGSFAFYCAIGDHRDRGMEGTLTVA